MMLLSILQTNAPVQTISYTTIALLAGIFFAATSTVPVSATHNRTPQPTTKPKDSQTLVHSHNLPKKAPVRMDTTRKQSAPVYLPKINLKPIEAKNSGADMQHDQHTGCGTPLQTGGISGQSTGSFHASWHSTIYRLNSALTGTIVRQNTPARHSILASASRPTNSTPLTVNLIQHIRPDGQKNNLQPQNVSNYFSSSLPEAVKSLSAENPRTSAADMLPIIASSAALFLAMSAVAGIFYYTAYGGSIRFGTFDLTHYLVSRDLTPIAALVIVAVCLSTVTTFLVFSGI